MNRPARHDDRGSAMLLALMAVVALLGVMLTVIVPITANSASVRHSHAIADTRRLGEEVLAELFGRVRDQRTTVPTITGAGQVTPGSPLPANPWATWNAAHTDFVACAQVADTCFYWAVRPDRVGASNTVRDMVGEVTVRDGCGTLDTCVYRRYQQTWSRRLISDYLMLAEDDSDVTNVATYIEGQPASTPTTPDTKAIVGGYWRNSSGSPWTVSNVDRGLTEELWQAGSTVTEALTKATNGQPAPKGALRIMTQLVLSSAGTYTITASSPDEGGQLRVVPRPNTPTFDVPLPDATLPVGGGSASVSVSGPTTVLIDFIALDNNVNKPLAVVPRLQITAPGSSIVDIAPANVVAMKATFDTANRSGRWWFDGLIHLNKTQWAACGQLDLYDTIEATATSGGVLRNGKSGCTPASRALDETNNAIGSTTFAAATPVLSLPTLTDLTEVQNVALSAGLQVLNSGSRIYVRSDHLDVWSLPASGAPMSYPLPTNSVTWIHGALEISTDPTAGAHDMTFLADGDVSVIGDIVGSNIGIVTKGAFTVAATNYKRTIDASIIALGKASNATTAPTPWLVGLPKLELFGSIAAKTPYQNVGTNGAFLPQFRLPGPPWTPPYFPQPHNAHWDRTSYTELPVSQGVAPAP